MTDARDRSMGTTWSPSPALWRDRSVLVTGGGGFLGTHLTAALVELGADVVAMLRDSRPVRRGLGADPGRLTVVRGDVRDQPLLERVLGEREVRTIFHLAAQTQVEVAGRNPVSTFESNVRGTWTVLEAARRSSLVEQVVVASSDKAYGAQPTLPYREEVALLPTHPYDVSKACADLMALSYHKVFGLAASVTRCGNFYGPGDLSWARMVPGTIRSLLRGERPLIRSDGTPVRDYLYVVDGARAYLCLAEAMTDRGEAVGEAFNFSAERPLSVLELVSIIASAAGREDIEPVVLDRVRHEIPAQHLAADKARRVLGWHPDHTVERAMAETVSWYRMFLGMAAR